MAAPKPRYKSYTVSTVRLPDPLNRALNIAVQALKQEGATIALPGLPKPATPSVNGLITAFIDLGLSQMVGAVLSGDKNDGPYIQSADWAKAIRDVLSAFDVQFVISDPESGPKTPGTGAK